MPQLIYSNKQILMGRIRTFCFIFATLTLSELVFSADSDNTVVLNATQPVNFKHIFDAYCATNACDARINIPLNLYNPTNDSVWYIGFGDSNTEILLKDIKSAKIYHCGIKFNLLEKEVGAGRGEFVKVIIKPDDTLYAHVEINNTAALPIQYFRYSTNDFNIYTESLFKLNFYNTYYINLFFYGAILIMVFYNLMLAITLKSRAYAYYTGFTVMFFLYNLASDGLIREVFFYYMPNYYPYFRLLIGPIMMALYLQFGRVYMQTAEYDSKWDKIVVSIIVALLSCYLLFLSGFWWVGRIIMLSMAGLAIVSMVAVSVIGVLKKYYPARYFLAANTLLLISGFLYLFYLLAFIHHTGKNRILEYLPQIASIIELAIFSLGLANRIKVIEQNLLKNQLEAEHEKQLLIEEKNEELEQKVRERTEELMAQKEEIAAINEQLEAKVRERTKKLQKAYRDLLNLNYELDSFIYRAAHDIRGPITTIMGLCNLALMEKDFDKCQEYLSILDKFSKTTQVTLNRILSVNDIKNNHIKPTHFTLGKLKEGILALLIDNPNRGKVKVTFHMNESEKVYYDFYLLQLIIQNLVDNAIRFRSTDPDAKPAVDVYFDKNEQGLKVTVKDNGLGVDDSIKEKIFDMFFRGSEYASGSGLGLYIARIAVKKMNGTLELLHSRKGETVFELFMPPLKERKLGNYELMD